MLTRRQLLALSAAGLTAPRALFSATGSGRRFLFVFAPGGWDVAQVFAPVEGDAIQRGGIPYSFSEANGIPFVHADSRDSVRVFFETWGARTALLNGIEVPSIAHEVCLRLIMTANPQPGSDCWTSLLAADSSEDLPMPAIHVAGPLYPVRYPGAVVRVGRAGQLPALLSGADLGSTRAEATAADVEALEDAYGEARLSRFAARAAGQGATVAADEELARERAARLRASASSLSLSDIDTLAEQGAAVADCFQLGLSRTGMVACWGYGDQGWDTHANNEFQDMHFETLFSGLNAILADLAARPGAQEASLLDETTVVVLSEMGRNPTLNASQGKDHWPWTSALLIGGGVAGGQAIGAWDETLNGKPVDLATGAATSSGVTLSPSHLGATLLALAGLDPAEHLEDSSPILAALA